MSMPWCVCISRSREATIQERKVSGLGEGRGSENDTDQRGIHDFSSDDDANEMDDLLADLEGGERASERAPLLGVGLGGQASRHRRWQPPLIRQQAGGLGSTAVAAVAKDPVARQGAAATSTRWEHAMTTQDPASTPGFSISSSNNGLAGRLESTALPTVDVGGADFIHFASELGVNLATETYAHESILAALSAPLPAPWSAHPAPSEAPAGESGSVYYYNADSQESTYLHPLLQQTRFVVTRQRQEHERRFAGSSDASHRRPDLFGPSISIAQQADTTGQSSNTPVSIGEDLGQTTFQKDSAASGGSAVWEARRRQLEIAAESPELGYADPWAEPSANEKDATPQVPVVGDATPTAGYIDSWAAQQQQEQTQVPEEHLWSDVGAAGDSHDGTILMPPGSRQLEARLASLAAPDEFFATDHSSVSASSTFSRTTPNMAGNILAPPMAPQLEERLASLDTV